MQHDRLEAEIDANYDFFRRSLSDFLPIYLNQFAVIRAQSIEGFYAEVADADRAARLAFPDGVFSIQKVIQGPIDLGFFSHAGC